MMPPHLWLTWQDGGATRNVAILTHKRGGGIEGKLRLVCLTSSEFEQNGHLTLCSCRQRTPVYYEVPVVDSVLPYLMKLRCHHRAKMLHGMDAS
jgi:hypothetical protein